MTYLLKNKYLFIIISGLFLITLPNYASGAELSKPVPSYDNVTNLENTTSVTITEAQIKQWQGKFFVNTNINLTGSNNLHSELVKFLTNSKVKPNNNLEFSFNPKEVYAWTESIATKIDSESVEPKLVIKNNRAVDFIAPTIGKKVDRYNSTLKILNSLQEQKLTNITLDVKTTNPKTTLAETNDLGITELIGRGESKFNGSPNNRRTNIKVGVNKIKGVIVKPGEEFSFNQYLGPVEAEYGFLPELVIRRDKGTVPELGGGLCQVSSTTFRAAMHAGLPITQRRNHSYAVGYYAPQGSDATIYPGVIDLKFKNDTNNNILIWPYFKTNDYLVFDFYGTRDGREVELKQPVQFDKKSDGSMKASWTRTVIKDGNKNTETFSSTYLPPALFHKTETFVPNPTTPSNPEISTPNNNTNPDTVPNNQTQTPTTNTIP